MDIVNKIEKEVRKYIEEYKNNSEDNYDFGNKHKNMYIKSLLI